MPFIWGIIIPLFVMDVCLEIYHHICFPLYGMPLVSRKKYVRVIDRAKLPYLNVFEKFGCAYCGYANGLMHYASEIAAKTEGYWCGIKHLEARGYVPALHENSFVPYGDKESLDRTFPLEKSL